MRGMETKWRRLGGVARAARRRVFGAWRSFCVSGLGGYRGKYTFIHFFTLYIYDRICIYGVCLFIKL